MAFYLSRVASSIRCYEATVMRCFSSSIQSNEKKPPQTIHGQEYPDWRTPVAQQPGEMSSRFRVFSRKGEKKESDMFKIISIPFQTWPYHVWSWFQNIYDKYDASFQKYEIERVDVLGCDLSVAYFIVRCGGAVRFDEDTWAKYNPTTKQVENLPKHHIPGSYVEAIDCENFARGGLRYEGLLNFEGLEHLKWLSLKGNTLIDDWCLDRLTRLTGKSLEYLDLRGCSVTHRGLNALYKTEKLKILILDKTLDSTDTDLICGMLQETLPGLLVKLD